MINLGCQHYIKTIISERQAAFASNNQQKWRKFRNMVKREIEKAKINVYANRVRNLQQTDPRKWHQQIQTIINSNKLELNLDIPGIEEKLMQLTQCARCT